MRTSQEKRLGDYSNTDSRNKAGKEQYEYDLQGRLKKKMVVQNTSGSNTETLFNQELYFQRDVEDNLTEDYSGTLDYTKMNYQGLTQSSDQEQIEKYRYDDLGRLQETYEYDHENSEYQTDHAYHYDLLSRFELKNERVQHDNYVYYEGTSRLKKYDEWGDDYSETPSQKVFVYDKVGNMILDINKGMYIKYNWRGLPVKYSFYSGFEYIDIHSHITVNSRGECNNSQGVKEILDDLCDSGSIELKSKVVMFYDADGKRVGKVAVGM